MTFLVTVPEVSVRVDVATKKRKFTNQQFLANRHAISFNGTTTSVEIADNAAYDNAGTVTLESWFKLSNVDNAQRIISTHTTGAYWYLRLMGQKKIQASFRDSDLVIGTVTGTTIIKENQPYHAAAVLDGTAIRLYLNGELEWEVAFATTGNFNPIAPIMLGAFATGSSTELLSGSIEEARIWTVARTQQQIKDNIKTELAGTETGLVGYYKMTDGTGTVITDSSPTANNGTMTNGAWIPKGKRLFIDTPVAAFSKIGVTPLGSQNRSFAVDNLSPGTLPFYDVFLWDGSNNLADSTFNSDVEFV